MAWDDAITYPVDVANTKWAVYDTEENKIIGRNKEWPVADGGPIPGHDDRYVYLLQTKAARPGYDPRLYVLQSVEQADIPACQLTTTYSAVARDLEARKQAAENEENRRLENIVGDLAKEAIQTRLTLGAIIAYSVDGETMPAKIRAMADDYKAKAVRLWRNRDRLDEIIAQIENSEDPDLDLWPEE